jgi:hypothetical protein
VLGQVVRFRFKVRALPNAQSGSSTVHGSLTFQTISATGVSQLQAISVPIPVTVVEHNARVETEASYLRGPSSTRVVLTVLLAPVLLVVGIVGLITGWDC